MEIKTLEIEKFITVKFNENQIVSNLNNQDEVLIFIKQLIDNSLINKFVKTEILEDELHIICDDGTIYKLTIR